MDDTGPRGAPWAGPWLQLACFCERAIIDTEGVLTIVRLVDRVIRTTIGAAASPRMEPFDWQAWIAIALKPGDARGRGQLTIHMEPPSGLSRQIASLPMNFDSPDRGVNLVEQVRIRFELEGLYWFDLRYEGHLLTRMPYRVIYQPTPGPAVPA